MHESSFLGKSELHEELNIHVLPILFEDHQNYMDDTHKVVCIAIVSIQNKDDSPQAKLPKVKSNYLIRETLVLMHTIWMSCF